MAMLAMVRGQPTAVETLRRAIALGRVHHAYLFDGPDGVGKELAAFGLAQALVCERRPAGSAEACGACSACSRAVPRGAGPSEGNRPVHPDVVVLERGLYEAATIGRRSPETQDISIDQVRTLVLARAAFPPYEGRARVFIVRRAEELSPSAANALLKTLEEPGARTHFVLLSSSADALLPTIRSRTLRIRFGALADGVVSDLLADRGVDRAHADEIAPLAGGSMATALLLSDAEANAQRDGFVSRAMAAIESRDLALSLALAEEAKKGDKQALIGNLEALAGALGSRARASVAVEDRRAGVAAARHALAVEAIDQIEANGSTQLTVEGMLIKMRSA
jgi:DNA polymerase III subunit delta'